MNKKTYIRPALHVVRLEGEACLQVNSVTNKDAQGPALSKRAAWDVVYDDDDE